jgi:(S)-2-hydroxyglutarate dehydrogenase
MSVYDFAIVGGGIVGLATGMALGRRDPAARILLLEKEAGWACHQSGRNSGVIHSGIYYKPGSLKARMARAGNRSMVRFCRQYGIAHEVCGKVIVATAPAEMPRLEALFRRSQENELATAWLGREELREIEPHVEGIAAIRVPSAGIVSYRQVCETMARLAGEQGADLRLNARVETIVDAGDEIELGGSFGTQRARVLINCAGLHSDRVARRAGRDPGMKIIPFRGEYYKLKSAKRDLVRHLIYPVPDPNFPFLGVHFTRMIHGEVEAGPNAVLSLKREGYVRTDFNLVDCGEVLLYPGTWKLMLRHWRAGAEEVARSFSKAVFIRSLQRLIPEIRGEDLEPAPAGVRAQALRPNGELVDDFHILSDERMVHVCNAPSPAATASLAIAEAIVQRIPAQNHLPATVITG